MLKTAVNRATNLVRERRWRRVVEQRLLRARSDRPPRLIDTFDEGPVVVVAPHMDDETFGCGGTMIRHKRAGVPVSVLYLTDGSRGSSSLELDPTLSQRRKDEAKQAVAALGGADLEFMDYPDRALRSDKSTVQSIAERLMRLSPRLVYFPSIFETHPDHIAACHATSTALALIVNQLSMPPLCREYEVWSPLMPNAMVDISDVLEIKLDALRKFHSQLIDFDYVNLSRGLSTYRSLYHLHGRGAAEAFCEFSVSTHQAMLAGMQREVAL